MSGDTLREKLTPEGREQQLVDLCFSLVLSATNDWEFRRRPDAEKAAWVARELEALGWKTSPCGSSWGVLEP